MRHLSGFDLMQVTSEFRALRAAVLRLWGAQAGAWEPDDIEDVTRFSEIIDQALAESMASYSARIDESRDAFLIVLGHDLRGPLATLSNCIQLQSAVPVPPEALQVIFNPLVQFAKSKSAPHERPSTSLGLGLFIAREIVLAHGGTIDVTSTAEAVRHLPCVCRYITGEHGPAGRLPVADVPNADPPGNSRQLEQSLGEVVRALREHFPVGNLTFRVPETGDFVAILPVSNQEARDLAEMLRRGPPDDP